MRFISFDQKCRLTAEIEIARERERDAPNKNSLSLSLSLGLGMTIRMRKRKQMREEGRRGGNVIHARIPEGGREGRRRFSCIV